MAPPSGKRRDEDDAPWLAEVESDGHASTLVPRGRFIGGVTLFVLLLLVVVIGIYFITTTKQDGASGTPVSRAEDAPLITADPGPYKVRPTDAGGMTVEGGTVYGIGNGDNPRGELDGGTMPEEPGPRPGEEPVALLPGDETLRAIPPAPAAAGAAAQSRPAPPAPAVVAPAASLSAQPGVPPVARPKPGASTTVPLVKTPPAPVLRPMPAPVVANGGTTLQLGAFSSSGKAEQAWKSLSTRFSYLAPLGKRIEPVEHDTGTLYRLRATGSADPAAAAQACAMLKVAGEACVVVK